MENEYRNRMFSFWKWQQLIDGLLLAVEEMFQSYLSRGMVISFTEREALEENRLHFLYNELANAGQKRDSTA